MYIDITVVVVDCLSFSVSVSVPICFVTWLSML